MGEFDDWFSTMAGGSLVPHDWQRSLAAPTDAGSRVIRIPTGMGKTLGVLAAWAWHRLHLNDERWPRRLVWCLPMRVLVEQTEDVVGKALERVGLLWDGTSPHRERVGVHRLMGGAGRGGEWQLHPEQPAVLIGTQDMLLSRALNRGYACSRAAWPLEFGLLSHDALWVMDEVQLMDVGLATSGQIQAYHDQNGAKGFRPRHTWWMSATLQEKWLRTVDTEPVLPEWLSVPIRIEPDALTGGAASASKSLALEEVSELAADTMATRILDEHKKLKDAGFGRITLAICNRVSRACEVHDALRKLSPTQDIVLVHSRFRPHERVAWRTQWLERAACVAGVDRIIVATQVVEAGVDISAGCVVTELAPWSSLVQRFGRCARYGGNGLCLVIDRETDEKGALPYLVDELQSARVALRELREQGNGAGLAALEVYERHLTEADRLRLYPYAPKHLLLRQEFDELFDTTPDLTGADIDISRFIRSGDERDLLVSWASVPATPKGRPPLSPSEGYQPRRDELCPVPFLQARDWLCGKESKTDRKPRLRRGMRAWVWDWLDGAWVPAERSLLTPGRIVCVASECGGYSIDRGFDSTSTRPVDLVPVTDYPQGAESTVTDDSSGSDPFSAGQWKTIGCHGDEVVSEGRLIGSGVGLPPSFQRVFDLAGSAHDIGKVHPAFAGAIRGPGRPARLDLAKAPSRAWLRPPGSYQTSDGTDRRPGLRHELASALALFAVVERCQPQHPALLGPWQEMLALLGNEGTSTATAAPTPYEQAVLACSAEEFDLLAYLVVSHHGKVRMALHASPKDQDYPDRDGRGLPIRGVREGDALPAVRVSVGGEELPSLVLTLEPAALGLSGRTGRSWGDRSSGLLRRFGPGALAWMEALFIAADRRASRSMMADPTLVPVEVVP